MPLLLKAFVGKTFVMVQKSAKLFSRVAFVIYGKFHALAVYVMYIICSYAFQIAYHPNNCVLLYKLLCSLSHLVPIEATKSPKLCK